MLALIHLTTKIEFSERIQPVKMPKTRSTLTNKHVIAIGHGNVNDNNVQSKELKFATLRIISQLKCRNAFPILADDLSVFCAICKECNQSVCDGDSGGPLVSESDHILVGISSFIGPSKLT